MESPGFARTAPPPSRLGTLAAASAWAGVLGQYALFAAGRGERDLGAVTVDALTFFTVQANLAGAGVLTLPRLAPRSALGRWCERASPRGAVVLYLGVTAGVYAAVLAPHAPPMAGAARVADGLLHVVTPALVGLDWALSAPKALAWRDAPRWLAFPAAWAVWMLLHGALSGFHPYPFLDPRALGLPAVLATLAALGAALLALGLAFVAAGRALAGVGAGR